MWRVIISLLPAICLLTYFEGSRWLANLLLIALSAVFWEALILKMRGYSLKPATDGSIVLTAILLGLSLPVSAPAWLLILGSAFAVIFGKQIYGGLGMNPFNPAMVGYAFCLVSFPAIVGQHSVQTLDFMTLFNPPPDVISSATILDSVRNQRINQMPIQADFSHQALIVNVAYLAGAFYLAKKRFLDFRLILAVLIGGFLTATVFYFVDKSAFLNPFYQLNAGALILGACYIATDPVTASTTIIGRWIYGFFIGTLAIIIRNIGQFPDGVAFAVLICNALAPILDPITKPKYE